MNRQTSNETLANSGPTASWARTFRKSCVSDYLYQTVLSLALIFQRCLSDRRCLQPIFKAVIGEV